MKITSIFEQQNGDQRHRGFRFASELSFTPQLLAQVISSVNRVLPHHTVDLPRQYKDLVTFRVVKFKEFPSASAPEPDYKPLIRSRDFRYLRQFIGGTGVLFVQ